MNQNSFWFYTIYSIYMYTLTSIFLFRVTINLSEMNNNNGKNYDTKITITLVYTDPMKLEDPLFCWKFQALSNGNKINRIMRHLEIFMILPTHEEGPPPTAPPPLKSRVPPQEEGHPPHEEGQGPCSRGFFSLCITIYRRKNHNCKKRQWCLWDYEYLKVHVCMCPLSSSMHQFIEISICALKNKNKFKHFNAEWPRSPPPKLSGEPSSIWEENKFRGFPHEHQPCPSCTDVQVDVSMERKLSKAYKHVIHSNFMSVSVKKFKQLNMGLIRYYSEQSTSNSMNCRKILHHPGTTGNGAIFFFG